MEAAWTSPMGGLKTLWKLMDLFFQLVESMQCEILVVVIAVYGHYVVFHRYKLFSRGWPKAACDRKGVDIVAANPKVGLKASTAARVPLPFPQRLHQPCRKSNPLVHAVCLLVDNYSGGDATGEPRDACQLRRTLAGEIRGHFGVDQLQTLSAATAEMVADALEAMCWQQRGIVSCGINILAALREVLGTQGILRSERLTETILWCYLVIDAMDAFDGFVADLEATETNRLPLTAREAILKGALKKADFHECMYRFESIRQEWVDTSSPRQCFIQHLGRIGAKQGHMLEVISALRGVRPSCETVNVLLSAARQCGDTESFRAVVRLGREHAVCFNTVTYCILLSEACSIAESEQLLDEALASEKGPSTRGVLGKAAEMAADRCDKELGDAVLRRLPTSRSEIEQRFMGAVAALLRIAAAVEDGKDQNNREEGKAVIRVYEQHFADLDFSLHAQAETVLVDAALACERADILSKVLSSPSEERQVASLKRLGASGRLAEIFRVLGHPMVASLSQRHAWLEAAVSVQDIKLAERIFQEAERNGQLDSTLYSDMIKAHLEGKDAHRACSLLRDMQKSGLELTVSNQNELIESAIQAGPDQLAAVLQEFTALGQKLTNANAAEVLKHLGQNPECGTALLDKLDEEMDEAVFCEAIEACIRTGRADLLKPMLKRHWVDRAVQARTTHAYASAIRAYGCLEDVDMIWATWRLMRRLNCAPTSVAIGCMVGALATNGLAEAGYELIRELRQDQTWGPYVNSVVHCSVIKSFSHQNMFDRAWSVYSDMLEEGMSLSAIAFNTIVDACARCGEMSRVPGVLNEMARQKVELDLVTYSSILKGYCKDSRMDRAFDLLKVMRETTSYAPDEIMYNTLLDGCAQHGLYDKGVQVLAEMERDQVKPSNYTLSLLVKLAGRAGQLQKAFDFVEDLPRRLDFKPNVHVYAGLVQASLQQRSLYRAKGVLERMAREQVRVDARIYALMMRACIAAGDMKDAEGLLRTACGLKGGHPALRLDEASAKKQGCGTVNSSTFFALQSVTEIAAHALKPILDALTNADELNAKQLIRDLQSVPRFPMHLLDGKRGSSASGASSGRKPVHSR